MIPGKYPQSRLLYTTAILLLASTAAIAGTPRIIGEHLRDTVLETPHPYPSGGDTNGMGEGPAGNATPGPRTVDSTGACPGL
jgi:hypothetical protein